MHLIDLIRKKGNNVVTVRDDDSIATAAKTLVDNNVGSALVLGPGGTVLGIVAERDLVYGLATHGSDLHALHVRDVMNADLIRCHPHDDVLAAMSLMTNRRVRHITVFNGEELLGVISIGDLVKHRIDEIETEARHLREYISA